MNKPIILANFGGPRNLNEIHPFLTALLTDPDVIRTSLPAPLQKRLFKRIANKRSMSIRDEYAKMGGSSPIYKSTKALAAHLSHLLNVPVLTFHRYLPMTHPDTFNAIEALDAEEITVFPLFPQFSYATTGSIARLFQKSLSPKTLQALRWVPSYYQHDAFIDCFSNHINTYLQSQSLDNATLFFSPHGVPKSFICTGDPYKKECEASYKKIMEHFPNPSILAYQSKFGPAEWLRPYTDEVCENITEHTSKGPVVFIPLSFTSDHIETLVEVEDLYLPVIEKQGMRAYRCPAFNETPQWIDAIIKILHTSPRTSNATLMRNDSLKCPGHCKKLCPYVPPLVPLEHDQKPATQSASETLQAASK